MWIVLPLIGVVVWLVLLAVTSGWVRVVLAVAGVAAIVAVALWAYAVSQLDIA
jgi:hypothetical protein